MAYRGEYPPFIKFVTVAKLQQLLTDPRLQPTDELHTRTLGDTGNLGIYRGAEFIGFIDLMVDEIFFDEGSGSGGSDE